MHTEVGITEKKKTSVRNFISSTCDLTVIAETSKGRELREGNRTSVIDFLTKDIPSQRPYVLFFLSNETPNKILELISNFVSIYRNYLVII